MCVSAYWITCIFVPKLGGDEKAIETCCVSFNRLLQNMKCVRKVAVVRVPSLIMHKSNHYRCIPLSIQHFSIIALLYVQIH